MVHDDALVPPVAVRYVPAAHCLHTDALVPPTVVLYVPAAHGVQDVAPAALQEPAVHRAADVGACVVDVQAEPAGQAVQLPAPARL
jgi:hypothetical protein